MINEVLGTVNIQEDEELPSKHEIVQTLTGGLIST